ncbi:MAG: C1 family peptidase [bacterium]|nr:C1 family peptidase [bacterium]
MINHTVILMLLCGALFGTSAHAQSADGALSAKKSQELLKSIAVDAPTRAAINAVSNNDIRGLALNRDILARTDDVFSFNLPTKGITNQESTGRCWMFAGLNLMRQDVIKKWDMEEFELSQSYLAFWDLFEKSNVFLEYIIATRDRDIMDRELSKMLEQPVGDGGYWEYMVSLVQKHGVVPKSVMGETNSSANTGRMHGILKTLLRRQAMTLRTLGEVGKTESELRAEKPALLAEVMRLLVLNYGVPPTEFEWRTTDSTGKVSEPQILTPREFYDEVIGVDLSEYVSLGSYSNHPFGKNYVISATRPMAEKQDVSFVNVEMAMLKQCALAALLDSNRVWFGCDVGKESYSKKGLLMRGVLNYEELFGVDLDMPKTARLNYRDQTTNHAMVFVGVDMLNEKPRKWRVENSWGKDPGDGGYFVMSDDWFDEYVMNVIVPRRYVPAEVSKLTSEAPVVLPIWDPTWESLKME